MPRNFAEAVGWYRLAATDGDPEAQYALGIMYSEGRGVPVDLARASDYLLQAAASGKLEAMYRLALLHFENHAGAIDDKTALDLLTRAADSGLADAQFELGELLFKGDGLPKDPVAGNRRLLSAAQLGHIGAQVEYAIHLFNGDGVAKNEADAAAWFERAAAMGNPVAQNRLARILSVGSTGTHDIDAALPGVTELQCGSYVFLDDEYMGIDDNSPPSFGEFRPSLSVLATVVNAVRGAAIVDAGIKAFATDVPISPRPIGRPGLSYRRRGDEFGELGSERAEHVPLPCGPADGELVQGGNRDGADRAAGWSDKPG